MKKVLILTALLTITAAAHAKNSEREILKDSKTFPAEVSNSTVRCSAVGYGNEELKINLSALDGWTLFDHTNANFGDIDGEPCMTAGLCKRHGLSHGFSVEDVIQNNPAIVTITVLRTVKEVKMETVDQHNQRVCQRSLREELETTIRGIKFHHVRSGFDQNFPIEVCNR